MPPEPPAEPDWWNGHDTQAKSAALPTKYGEPTRTEEVPCTTNQWNHPVEKDRPFVGSDGECAVCGQVVGWDRIRPDNPSLYSRVAVPHTRTKRWFEVSDTVLLHYEAALDDH